jgi:hypothetical protein
MDLFDPCERVFFPFRFKDDEFNGMGTFKWPTTGESYVGWWRDGEMHGR